MTQPSLLPLLLTVLVGCLVLSNPLILLFLLLERWYCIGIRGTECLVQIPAWLWTIHVSLGKLQELTSTLTFSSIKWDDKSVLPAKVVMKHSALNLACDVHSINVDWY